MKNIFLSLFIFATIVASAQKDSLDKYFLNSGDPAPDITGVDPEGAQAQLSKVDHPYTLVYFYEVGCNHCDQILPVLINLYNEYKGSGLEIFAVPMEADKEKWIKFVEKNHFTWRNVFLEESELIGLRKDYKLYMTPTIYLLDKNKKVMGKHLQMGDEVEKALKKYVK